MNEILKKCKMIFQLSIADLLSFMKRITIKSSYPGALKSYNFVWNFNIFRFFSFIVITKSFMLYFRSRDIL